MKRRFSATQSRRRATRPLLALLVGALLASARATAQQPAAPPPEDGSRYYYVYEGRKIALTPDYSRVRFWRVVDFVEPSADRDREAQNAAEREKWEAAKGVPNEFLRPAGFDPADGRAVETFRAWDLDLGAAVRSDEALEAVVASLAALPEVRFISPVFVVEEGEAVSFMTLQPTFTISLREDAEPLEAERIIWKHGLGRVVRMQSLLTPSVHCCLYQKQNGLDLLQALVTLHSEDNVVWASANWAMTRVHSAPRPHPGRRG